MDIMRAEDDVNPGILRLDRIDDVLLLHHTAADADQKFRIFFFSPFQLSESSKETLVRILPDTAGVDDGHIGFTALSYLPEPFLHQHAGHDLRIVFVHLAAKSCYMKSFAHCLSRHYSMCFSFFLSLPMSRSTASFAEIFSLMH